MGLGTKRGDTVLVPGPPLHLVPWEGCLMCLATTTLQDLHHCLWPSLRDRHPSCSHLGTLTSCPGDAGTGHSLELTHVFAFRQNPAGEPQNHSTVQEACKGEELH